MIYKELYETVIEQYGGYEKCKEILEMPNIDFIMNAQALREHMLKYRRANNIFEVGDPIIRRWNNRVYWIITDVDNGSEFMISEDKNAKFKDCKVCDMPCNFTFATPEEIQAGHRL